MFAKVTSLLALVVALGGGALAVGAIPAPNGTINACFTKRTGALRVVDSKRTKCRKGERAIAWNQRGAAGLSGERGVAGPKGDAGAPGAPGKDGVNGTDGTNGTNGTDGTDGSPDTPAQVLAKVTQVDGSGSGLDADTVDGKSPASSFAVLASFTENGGTVSFAQHVTIPGLGTIESDCNTETDTDTRFRASTDNVHVMVDSGGGNALQASDIDDTQTTTAISSTSYTAGQPEFQIWRIQVLSGSPRGATVFLEIRPQSSTVCEWRSQTIQTT